MGPDFSSGLFVAHDSLNTPAENLKLAPWASVANAFNPPLRVDTQQVDAGTDGGTGGTDAGTGTGQPPPPAGDGGDVDDGNGCSCATASVPASALLGLLALALAGRRRRS